MSEVKIVVLGSGGVGKTCLTIQFTTNQFVQDYDPTIEDNYRVQAVVDEESCLLDILDTAGQEEYAALRDQYMRFGEGFLLIFDLTQKTTFEELPRLRELIIRAKDDEKVPILLVGNKNDLESHREVPAADGEARAKLWDCKYIETSAKKLALVENVFFEIVRAVRRARGASSKKSSKCTLL